MDLWKFQRNEIESANLREGDDLELESERRILQNVSRISDNASTAYSALYDAADSAYAQVRIASKRLDELRRIDDELGRIADLLKPAEIAIDEAAGELRDYLGRLEADPGRLEEVESRLAAIDKLKRKYGSTIEEILTFVAEVATNMDAAENAADRRTEIERRREQLASDYETMARKLVFRPPERSEAVESNRCSRRSVLSPCLELSLRFASTKYLGRRPDWTLFNSWCRQTPAKLPGRWRGSPRAANYRASR